MRSMITIGRRLKNTLVIVGDKNYKNKNCRLGILIQDIDTGKN
jgi:hypothetical protein